MVFQTIFEVNEIGILKVTHVEECTKRTVEYQIAFDGPKIKSVIH